MSKKLYNDKAIRAGLIKNEKVIQKMIRTDIEPDMLYSVELPNIYKNDLGEWDFDGGLIEISTLAEFNQYASENEELYQFIKENYPSIISVVWQSAFSKLYGSTSVASKLLRGESVDLDTIIKKSVENEYSTEEPTIHYILTKVNGSKSKENPVTIKPHRRTKKEVMNYFADGIIRGYFLPEISEKGAVVDATKGKRLCVKFFTVGADEYTEEQIKEYLMANADAGYEDPNVNKIESEEFVDSIIKLSKTAYSALISGNPESLRTSVEKMNIACAYIYRPDFSLLEDKGIDMQTEYLSGDESDVKPPVFDGEQLKFDLGDVDKSADKEKPYIEKIVIEGDTNSQTRFDAEKGRVVLTLTADGKLGFRVEFEDEEKTLRAVPVEKEMQ